MRQTASNQTTRARVLQQGWRPSRDRDRQRAQHIGQTTAAQLPRQHPLPPLVIETYFSILQAPHSPACWHTAFNFLRKRQQTIQTLLADHGDLMGLPATLQAWGCKQTGVGVQLPLNESHRHRHQVLIIAHNQTDYGRICELCSWRQEEPHAWHNWLKGDATCPISWQALHVCIRDVAWAQRLLQLGATVHWWSGRVPSRLPSALRPYNIPVIAAPVLRWLSPDDYQVQPVLDAIRRGQTVSSQTVSSQTVSSHSAANGHAARDRTLTRSPSPSDSLQCCFTDLPRIAAAYADFPEQRLAAEELFAQSQVFSEHALEAPTWHLPPAPHTANADSADSADQELRRLCTQGIPQRYGPGRSDVPLTTVQQRLEHELRVIKQTRFASYILTVHDLAQGRRTCGRGSAASSLVCYLLQLTNVDPIHYQLLFERFLMPERRDPPDIDIDFPWDERNEVIHQALHRYGTERAGLVSTHPRLNRWSALREAARALGLDDRHITGMRQKLHDSERFGKPVHLDGPWPLVLANG
jgi:DNA polymerase III alpha subunit